jgi:hypothetical protein
MSSTEIPCSRCNFIFNDNQLYNLHLTNCASNKNNDPKNKYYCPICNRQFRLLSNLLRHNETRKHQELLEWHVNKMSSGPNTNNVKNISVNLTDEELESTSRKSQSKTFDLDLDLDLDEKPNITTLSEEITLESEDPFLANLQNTYSQQNIQQNLNQTSSLDSHSQIQLNIEPQIEEPDNFLQNLIKEREKVFASFTNISNTSTNTSHTSRKDEKDSRGKQKTTKVVGFTIQEDDAVNLRSEIEKAKCQLGSIHFYTENIENTQKIEKTEDEDEGEDALLNNIQSLRTSKMNNLSAKLEASKKINSESKTVEEYPSSYNNLPLWKNLQVIVKNSQAPRLLVSFLISTPLNDYPKICTFVYFSKELKENKSLKINMVRAMIEVKNHLNQLFNKRQTVWNGKHIPLTLALMNKWKLEDFLKTLL